jgi:hypothetical protein
MFDCSDDVLAYHSDEVTLPQADRTEMRDRRDANRNRAKDGLKKNKRPLPREFCSQGSYAMLTMVQYPRKDYDIDDGAYFLATDLVGPPGGEMTALQARQMVRDAIDDGCFTTAPEVRKNCVRVYYEAGYHVDVAVYRIKIERDVFGNEKEICELASSSWKRSDARKVTDWFDQENTRQSPDTTNGRQLRRITRFIKKFARSRDSWSASIARGLTITKLVTERYYVDSKREDAALYNTMKAIRDRLNSSLEVAHPVTPGDSLTKGTDDAKSKFLRSKLTDALGWLDVLFDPNCTRTQALAAWDKVFNADYFSNRDTATSKASASLLRNATPVGGLTFPNRPVTPRNPGGFA